MRNNDTQELRWQSLSHQSQRSSNNIKQRNNRNQPRRQWLALCWLLVLAILCGIVIGLILPKINHTAGQLTGEYEANGEAAQVLQNFILLILIVQGMSVKYLATELLMMMVMAVM